MEEEVLWCGGALLATLSVIYLYFKAHLTRMATTAICRPIWFGLSGAIICFSTGHWPITHPGYVRAILPRRVMESDGWPGLHNHHKPQSNWDGLGWVGPQGEGKAANKCSSYVGTPSRRWMKLVERMPRVCKAVIKAKGGYFEEYKIYFDLFQYFFAYFIVLMSSPLFYNVENSKK